ncbi:LAMI_0E14752g1_1 [Lachancea mirantina]|uniref:LAMI_0E14752g1_1 n=1 Tax=Lachancea mirantina TaxID=1230905 RepID=A0A1G4JS22_9SACH|nr:LAMI_0E14752g1_1 [Lachancea mirantina]
MATAQAQDISTKYTGAQQDLESLVIARQKLETQLQENKIVQDEFDTLKDDTQVYKLTGSVLLPVDQDEAKNNVSKRLEFISTEISRCEENIKNKQTELETLRSQLVQLQSSMQQS